MKKIAILSLSFVLFANIALAAEFIAPDEGDGNVNVPSSETHTSAAVNALDSSRERLPLPQPRS